MWINERDRPRFAARYGISEAAADSLRCTGEHVHARQSGGSDDQWNIAAACIRCNRARHENNQDPMPLQHRQKVGDAMAAGVWHVPEIHVAFAGRAGTTLVGKPPAMG